MTAISPAAAAMPGVGVVPAQTAAPQGNGVTPIVVTSPAELPSGVMPISQAMLAQAMGQGQLGAAAVQPPSTAGTVLGSMLKGVAMAAPPARRSACCRSPAACSSPARSVQRSAARSA